LKKILDSIKDLVTDGNFECTSTGITLQAMDSAHVSLVHLLLKSSGFENFKCNKNLTLGMNMLTLNKMMKCVGNDDSITIKSTGQGDVVTFHVKSSDDETASEFEVKLVEIEADQLGIPETSYSSVIKMPSAKFKKIIGDMGSMGDTCTITAGKKGVTFSVKGEEISGSTTVKQHASVDKADEAIVIETSEDLSLTFALKYLNIFCKSTTLASSVTLSLSTDSPLMVEYKMKDLGHIRYYLAPKIDEDGVKKEKDD
jgi:proliferating cell nuclear antigen